MLNFVPFAPAHFDELIPWFPTEPETIGWGGALIRFPLDQAQCVTMVEEGRCEPPVRLSWMVERDSVWVGFIGLVFDWRHGNATVFRVAVAPAARGRALPGRWWPM